MLFGSNRNPGLRINVIVIADWRVYWFTRPLETWHQLWNICLDWYQKLILIPVFRFSVTSNIFYIYVFSYTIVRTGDNSEQTVNHADYSSSSRISTTWNDLNPGETYTFTVACKLQGADCEGGPVTFTARSCSG